MNKENFAFEQRKLKIWKTYLRKKSSVSKRKNVAKDEKTLVHKTFVPKSVKLGKAGPFSNECGHHSFKGPIYHAEELTFFNNYLSEPVVPTGCANTG